MIRFTKKSVLLLVACLFVCLGCARPALADAKIVLDGRFDDWLGRMYVTDPAGDSHSYAADIVGFYWADNPDDETCYWMIERAGARGNVSYIVYFDANNNGRFTDSQDRAVIVEYRPKKNDSKVSLEVRQASDWQLIDRSNNNDWGESLDQGAARVEFGVSFRDLGLMNLGQTVRMYAASFGPGAAVPSPVGPDQVAPDAPAFNTPLPGGADGESEVTADLGDNRRLPWPDDRIPDSGDVQWSPVPVLGYPLLAAVTVGGILGIWYFKGRHAWRSR
jgi:hypothetical protein